MLSNYLFLRPVVVTRACRCLCSLRLIDQKTYDELLARGHIVESHTSSGLGEIWCAINHATQSPIAVVLPDAKPGEEGDDSLVALPVAAGGALSLPDAGHPKEAQENMKKAEDGDAEERMHGDDEAMEKTEDDDALAIQEEAMKTEDDEALAIQEERPMHQEALKKAEDDEALAIQIILRLC